MYVRQVAVGSAFHLSSSSGLYRTPWRIFSTLPSHLRDLGRVPRAPPAGLRWISSRPANPSRQPSTTASLHITNDQNSICVAMCRRTDQFRQRHGPRSCQQPRPKTSARPSHFFSLTLSDDQDDLIRRGRWGVGKRHAGLDATRRQSPATSTRFFYELN